MLVVTASLTPGTYSAPCEQAALTHQRPRLIVNTTEN